MPQVFRVLLAGQTADFHAVVRNVNGIALKLLSAENGLVTTTNAPHFGFEKN